jgi:hypothetical protein
MPDTPVQGTSILKKMSAIQRDIKSMEKDGTNAFHKYKYLSETQLTSTMKKLLDKHGVLFLYSSEITDIRPKDNQFLTAVKVIFEFRDVETGERVQGFAAGQGADSGDKGVYKAITGAIKYIYMKTFNIPTGDDPEKDDERKNPVVRRVKETRFIPNPRTAVRPETPPAPQGSED